MEVKGIRWIGVGTDRIPAMRAFATEVLGLHVAGEDRDDFVELAMADGTKLELFGSDDSADGPWLFRSNPVVAGFLVDDIEAARDELAGRGVDIGDIQDMPWGRFLFFADPDGNPWSVQQIPPRG